MKRSVGLAVVMAVIGMSSGCSLIDRLFLANCDGPYASSAHQHMGGEGQDGACQDGACQGGACQGGACEGGACQSGACQSGVCQASGCEDGQCAPKKCPAGICHGGPKCRHLGRYGGLARHHLTPEEEAALAESNYGQTGPAGPPSGAVAYPYYTTRGPRDFLSKCPPSIGP
jgi:hypothetical protein